MKHWPSAMIGAGFFIMTVLGPSVSIAQPVIYACVSNKNGANAGQVRVVSATEPCAKNESRISWMIGILWGQACPGGQFVTGIDTNGQIVCAAPGGSGVGGGGGGTPVDLDGDGVPDSVDLCPASANLNFQGSSYCPAAIFEVNNGLWPLGAALVLNNVKVQSVSGTSIVVAVEPGDPSYLGTPNDNSLTVALGAFAPPLVGSRINVIGVFQPGPQLAAAGLIIVSGP